MPEPSPAINPTTLLADLGVTHILHVPDVDRFPWQILLTGERCVLVSGDFRRHTLIRSSYYPGEAKYTIAAIETPPEVLETLRRALSGAGGT